MNSKELNKILVLMSLVLGTAGLSAHVAPPEGFKDKNGVSRYV